MLSVQTRRLLVSGNKRELWPSEPLCSVERRRPRQSRGCIIGIVSGVVANALRIGWSLIVSLGFLHILHGQRYHDFKRTDSHDI